MPNIQSLVTFRKSEDEQRAHEKHTEPSFFAKEPLFIGFFDEKSPIKTHYAKYTEPSP